MTREAPIIELRGERCTPLRSSPTTVRYLVSLGDEAATQGDTHAAHEFYEQAAVMALKHVSQPETLDRYIRQCRLLPARWPVAARNAIAQLTGGDDD